MGQTTTLPARGPIPQVSTMINHQRSTSVSSLGNIGFSCPPQEPGKILIVRLGSLGDIIHTLPAQQQIHRYFPKCQIHWLVNPYYSSLLQTVPGIKRLWAADTKQLCQQPTNAFNLISLVRSLRREHFDLTLDFQGLIKSALLARLSGAKKIVGFAKERCREPLASHFYTSNIEINRKTHVVDLNLELAASLGCPRETTGRVPFQIPSKAEQYVENQLKTLKGRRPVLLNPGAGWSTKLWPPHHYARLGMEIQRQLGLPVLFTYGPGEEQLIQQIQKCSQPKTVVSFPTTLLEFSALCKRSALIVAGDTGPLHLAVALGTPAVAVMGPSSAWRNGPFHRRDKVVKRYLYCSDCNKRRCQEFVCMNIPVDEVFSAVQKRLSEVPSIGMEIKAT